ncbi:MAG: ABC transporter ATP-binding protein [Cyanobacteriota bacterium]|nr:ABC transporter ATP-binding protein [Cyanobacteriota bacterium]
MTQPSAPPLLQVKDLVVTIPQGQQRVSVVDGIGFDLKVGETLGIVGESGSGKTMTALALMGLTPTPAIVSGSAWLTPPQGNRVNLLDSSARPKQTYRGRQVGMVFQDPGQSLNPVYSCGYQLQETLRTHLSMNQREAEQRAADLFAEVQLPSALLRRYPHQLSGGQRQRVAIACAIACDPCLLIADEPTTALDVTIQAEILKLLRQLQEQRQMSILLISHDWGVVAELADQVLVMYGGKKVEAAPISSVFAHPQHPYTQGLLACRPVLGRRLHRLPTTEDWVRTMRRQDGQLEMPTSSIPLQPLPLLEVSSGEMSIRLQRLQSRPPLLQVEGLQVHFPMRGVWRQRIGDIRAVDDISFQIYPGETLGVVGESGSGKSTLGRTILRLTQATAGSIRYDGEDWLALSRQRLRQRRREIQLVFQDPTAALDPRLTVGESVLEPMILHRLGDNSMVRRQRAEELFIKVGLDPQALSRMPHEFSGGQRQRICIARALASQPRLLICDEAVSSLDVSVQAQVLNLLKQLQTDLDLTYLFISHDLSVVQFMSDRILVMNRGRLEEIAPADQLYRDPQREYTRQLLAAIPTGDPQRRHISSLTARDP